MKDIDLSNFALEDLLSFDDIFLDYFNNFLRNAAFPQPLQFNRYLGVFEEVYNLDNLIEFVDRIPKHTVPLSNADGAATAYSLTDNVEQKVFDWVRKERLPLFFRTNLFREYKLCKLLVRALDEDRSDSHASSQFIGGYSRQSPPSSNTLSTEDGDGRFTTADIQDGFEMSPSTYYQQLEKLNKYLFQRPGSRAFSVPAYFPFFSKNELKIMPFKKSPKKEGNDKDLLSTMPKSTKTLKTNPNKVTIDLPTEKTDLKRLNNFEDLTKIDDQKMALSLSTKMTGTYDADNEENYDDDDEENENNGEDGDDAEIYSVNDETLNNPVNEFSYDEDIGLTDKVHASINQYKQKFLGSVRGLNDFRVFLRTTANGEKFLKFWLDCEFFRDSMQDYDQIENMATRNRLFRDINEKFTFPFSDKMHTKIRENYLSSYGLNHSVFTQIQYDILRRLRSYWVPRFILNKLRVTGKDFGLFPLPPLTPDFSRQSTYNTILSPPAKHTALRRIKHKQLGNLSDLNEEQQKSMLEKVKMGLLVDKEAGGPFLRFISLRYPNYLSFVLFRYDVNDFKESFQTQIDKKSRLQHAWAIYNNYLNPASRFHIGSSDDFSEILKKNLQNISANGNSDLDANLFEEVTDSILSDLIEPWIEYLKDDILRYAEAKLSILEFDEGLISLQDNLEPIIEIDANVIYINRPWVRKYFNSNSIDEEDKKNKQRVPMTEERRAELAHKRKIMETERRKAMRAARLRLKNQYSAAKKKMDPLEEDDVSESQMERVGSRYPSSFLSDKSLFFDKMMVNNKSMVQLMRKHLLETNQKELMNKFNCFVDARQYMEMHDAHKKMVASFSIQKIYLDPTSKRNVLPLTERLQSRLSMGEQRGNARPRTPFMSGITKEFRPALEEEFLNFCEIKSKEYGLKSPEEFAQLTQSELLLILGDNYNTKDFYMEDEKGEGKMMPSKDDRNEFIRLIAEWSIGKVDMKFYAFYAHLTEHGKKDGLPFLDKDLLFCIDSIRIKEINGDDVVKQKCQLILEFYLDSIIPPTVQIDINHEAHQKLIRSIARILQNVHSTIDFMPFDDVRAQLIKDILPYWAGFKHSYKPTPNRPLTKLERILKERLDEFFNVKNPSPNDFKLPILNNQKRNISQNGTLQIAFSLTTGIKYKDERTNQTIGEDAPIAVPNTVAS